MALFQSIALVEGLLSPDATFERTQSQVPTVVFAMPIDLLKQRQCIGMDYLGVYFNVGLVYTATRQLVLSTVSFYFFGWVRLGWVFCCRESA